MIFLEDCLTTSRLAWTNEQAVKHHLAVPLFLSGLLFLNPDL